MGSSQIKFEIIGDASKGVNALNDMDTASGKAVTGLDKVGKAAATADDKVRKFNGGGSAEKIEKVGDASGRAAGGMGDLAGALELAGQTGAADALNAVGIAIMTFAGIGDIVAALRELEVVQKLIATATRLWAVAQTILDVALSPMVLIILAIVAAIALLVAGIIWLWNNCETFRTIVTTVFNAVKDAIVTAFTAVKTFIITVWTAITSYLSGIWAGIKATASAAWNGIKSVASVVWNAIKTAITTPIAALVGWVKSIFDQVKAALKTAWDTITGLAKTAWEKIKAAMVDPIVAAKDKIAEVVGKAKEWITGAFTSAVNTAIRLVNKLIEAYNKIPLAPDLPTIPEITSSSAVTLGARLAPPGGVQLLDATTRALATPTVSTAVKVGSGVHVVNVYLDGRKVEGVIAQVVAGALNADGARLSAGAWGVA